MTKEQKLEIIKPILTRVLTAVSRFYPWLDRKQLKVGRDLDLTEDDGTRVFLYFQRCKTKEGAEISGIDSGGGLSFRQAEYYDEIYNTVGPVLKRMLEDDSHVVDITAGTWSKMTNIAGSNSSDFLGSYYGICIEIQY